jgi:hypothetical protein
MIAPLVSAGRSATCAANACDPPTRSGGGGPDQGSKSLTMIE